MSTSSAPAALVGEVFDLLRADDERSGLISGDPRGVGAEVLATVAAATTSERGAVIRLATNTHVGHPMPAVRALIDHLLTSVSTLSDDQRTTLRLALGIQIGAAPTRLMVCAALLSLIRHWATDHPGSLIIVEHAHLLDSPSRDILPFVIRRLGDIPVTVLMSSASEDSRFDDRIVDRVWYLAEPQCGSDATPDTLVSVDASVDPADLDSAADRMERAASAAAAGEIDTATALLAAAIDAHPDAPDTLERAVAESYLAFNRGESADPVRIRLQRAIDTDGEHASIQVVDDALWLLYFLEWYCGDSWGVHNWSGFRRAVSTLPHPPQWARLTSARHAEDGGDAPALVAEADRLVANLAVAENPITIVRTAFATRGLDRRFWWRDSLQRVLSDPTAPPAAIVAAAALLANERLRAGDWTTVDELVARARQVSQDQAYHVIGPEWTLNTGAMAAAYRGDSDAVEAAMKVLRQWSSSRGFTSMQWRRAHAQSVLALGAGNGRRAHQLLSKAVSAHGYLTLLDRNHRFVLDIAETAAAAGIADEIAALTARLSILERESTEASEDSMLISGALGILSGDRAHFERAQATPDADRRPFDLARIRLSCGRLLRTQRDDHRARSELLAAADTFRALGAIPWLRLTIEQLRLLGEQTSEAVAPLTGLLTPVGRRVADFAATGLSNREIGAILHVSPSTVGTHLSVVYAALGVTSRAALRDSLSTIDQ